MSLFVGLMPTDRPDTTVLPGARGKRETEDSAFICKSDSLPVYMSTTLQCPVLLQAEMQSACRENERGAAVEARMRELTLVDNHCPSPE